MPLKVKRQEPTVRKASIAIGSETFSVDWGREIPHAEAMRRVRIVLATFDREPAQETTDDIA